MPSAALAMAGMACARSFIATSKPSFFPVCWCTASHVSSLPSVSEHFGRRTNQAVRAPFFSAGARPHHQTPRRAFMARYFLMCSTSLAALYPSLSHFTLSRAIAPEPLLRCVGFTTMSKAAGSPSAWSFATKASTCSVSTEVYVSYNTGICGTLTFCNSLLKMILSPSAWMVPLPALWAFMAFINSLSRICPPVAVGASTLKSAFISKLRAAACHGARLRASTGAGGNATGRCGAMAAGAYCHGAATPGA
mmetsp:Transcript_60899/g.170289  ORF Transcript_60899/g.170289 Transcript_60899/m.170289 type:complete len:250 (+) Transcript_60899:688-1437(+)